MEVSLGFVSINIKRNIIWFETQNIAVEGMITAIAIQFEYLLKEMGLRQIASFVVRKGTVCFWNGDLRMHRQYENQRILFNYVGMRWRAMYRHVLNTQYTRDANDVTVADDSRSYLVFACLWCRYGESTILTAQWTPTRFVMIALLTHASTKYKYPTHYHLQRTPSSNGARRHTSTRDLPCLSHTHAKLGQFVSVRGWSQLRLIIVSNISCNFFRYTSINFYQIHGH